jgi:hypothetical protein
MKTAMTFNTGRRYTAEGQIITAEYDDETETMLFYDHSRMICGEFQVSSHRIEAIRNKTTFARIVMEFYDHCRYQMSGPAMSLKPLSLVHSIQI